MATQGPTYRPPTPIGQLWPRPLVEAAPKPFSAVAEFGELAPNATATIALPVPADRLYGTLVKAEGVSVGAVIEVKLYGNKDAYGNLADLQYSGTAKIENGFADAFQQWRFRDTGFYRLMYVQVRNAGAEASSVNIRIEGEPF